MAKRYRTLRITEELIAKCAERIRDGQFPCGVGDTSLAHNCPVAEAAKAAFKSDNVYVTARQIFVDGVSYPLSLRAQTFVRRFDMSFRDDDKSPLPKPIVIKVEISR